MTGQSTTETRKMVSASTLIGPFEFDRALATRPLLTCDRVDQITLRINHKNTPYSKMAEARNDLQYCRF